MTRSYLFQVDYEALEAKLEKSRPKPSKSEQKAEQKAAQAAKLAEQQGCRWPDARNSAASSREA